MFGERRSLKPHTATESMLIPGEMPRGETVLEFECHIEMIDKEKGSASCRFERVLCDGRIERLVGDLPLEVLKLNGIDPNSKRFICVIAEVEPGRTERSFRPWAAREVSPELRDERTARIQEAFGEGW